MSASEKLQAAIDKRGWSQNELARKLKVRSGVVSRWCTGLRTPSLRFALAIEKMFPEVPASSWLTRKAA